MPQGRKGVVPHGSRNKSAGRPSSFHSATKPQRPRRSFTVPIATERRNPATAALDSGDTLTILQLIHSQDALVPAAVRSQIPQIAKAVDEAVKRLRLGGRMIYVGAGTSGRLGVLDAAECPPTFGVSRGTIQAAIAGGPRALVKAAEAAEDDREQGARDLAAREIGPQDIVIGLTASGRTPYTIGALHYARSQRAATVAITSNPGSPVTKLARITIVPHTGPEVLSGSTRMKAALAQKMVLHMISTAVMARLGNVYRNYMVGVRPTNRKLVERACSILVAITGVDQEAAARALKESGNDVKRAIVMLRHGLNRAAATALLRRFHGNLRDLERSAESR